MGASPPWPSSLKFATNSAALSRAQNNLQEEGELRKKKAIALFISILGNDPIK